MRELCIVMKDARCVRHTWPRHWGLALAGEVMGSAPSVGHGMMRAPCLVHHWLVGCGTSGSSKVCPAGTARDGRRAICVTRDARCTNHVERSTLNEARSAMRAARLELLHVAPERKVRSGGMVGWWISAESDACFVLGAESIMMRARCIVHHASAAA